jgi:hypothetical protein
VSLEYEAVTTTKNETFKQSSTTSTQNIESVEVRSANSPMPPPRQRHNPFNRVQQAASLDGQMLPRGHNYRAHRYSSSSGRPDGTSRLTENIPRTKVTFRELHTAYGRRILSDFNAWRHAKRQEQDKNRGSVATQELLISLWNVEYAIICAKCRVCDHGRCWKLGYENMWLKFL